MIVKVDPLSTSPEKGPSTSRYELVELGLGIEFRQTCVGSQRRWRLGIASVYGCRRTVIGPEPNHVLLWHRLFGAVSECGRLRQGGRRPPGRRPPPRRADVD